MNIEEITEFSKKLKSKYKYKAFRRKDINLFNIPCNYITFKEEAETQEFSKIYQYVKENFEEQIVKTKSQGISILKKYVNKIGQYFVKVEKTQIQIVIQLYDEDLYKDAVKIDGAYEYVRFIISNGKVKDKPTMTGRFAYNAIKQVADKLNIDLTKYEVTNGADIKKQIEKPMICLGTSGKLDKIYVNVHHIDLNSAYWSQISKAFPDLYPVANELYTKRHQNNDLYKNALAMSVGYFQSEYINFKYAELSKAAINGTNQAIINLVDKLEATGRKVLLLNTDGIWYQGEIYHDDDEGTELGQWKTDHKNCKFRMKSKGAYEFIEDNKYYPVVRGTSSYENIVARENWQWGDIYQGTIIEYQWNKDKGLQVINNG